MDFVNSAPPVHGLTDPLQEVATVEISMAVKGHAVGLKPSAQSLPLPCVQKLGGGGGSLSPHPPGVGRQFKNDASANSGSTPRPWTCPVPPKALVP